MVLTVLTSVICYSNIIQAMIFKLCSVAHIKSVIFLFLVKVDNYLLIFSIFNLAIFLQYTVLYGVN
jgi:hypothetical protein